MPTYSGKYSGVYSVTGKRGVSYGIDYTHPMTGQRIRKILKECKSEAQANEIRAIEIADAARGVVATKYGIKDRERPVLFDDAADSYLNNLDPGEHDKRTATHRASVVKRYFKGKLLTDISPFSVQRFKRDMVKDKARSTVNKYLSIGSRIAEKAIADGKHHGINPFSPKLVKRYRTLKQKKPQPLSPEDVAAIMAEIKHPVKRDMVVFAYHTGWRISEITGLKWTDVDIKTGVAWIANPKNKTPAEIVLSDAAMEVVKRQKHNGERVFCHLNG
jgi:integrase